MKVGQKSTEQNNVFLFTSLVLLCNQYQLSALNYEIPHEQWPMQYYNIGTIDRLKLKWLQQITKPNVLVSFQMYETTVVVFPK